MITLTPPPVHDSIHDEMDWSFNHQMKKKKKPRVNLLTAPDGMYAEYVSTAAKHNVEFKFTEEQFNDFWVCNYRTYTQLSWR